MHFQWSIWFKKKLTEKIQSNSYLCQSFLTRHLSQSMIYVRYLGTLLCFLGLTSVLAQEQPDSLPVDTTTLPIPDVTVDYSEKVDYEIGDVKVTGANFSDENAIKVVSGLKKGNKITIPGDAISRALESLWRQKLFSDIQIIKDKVIGDVVFLEIVLKEKPRLSRHIYTGVKKVYEEDLNDLLKPFLLRGGIVTEATKSNAEQAIANFFVKKGYLDAEVNAVEEPEPKVKNAIVLNFKVNRNERVKIDDIVIEGNKAAKDKKIRKQMKNTKWRKRFLASSKFIRSDFEEDKVSVLNFYNNIGYRDARILSDTTWRDDEGKLYLGMTVEEGDRYYFRNISWKGNSIYDDEQLEDRLGIKKGDVYNQELLDQRLQFSMDGRDVSSLYMDNGYLFFRVDPTEVAIDNDSIDLEMRIFEGPQATIDKVSITGNDRTHEHVIRRELRTKPGEKFSRSELIRSQRQIINLGYFNPETLEMNTPVNPNRGTVDIEYGLEEKSSDQLELSAGYQPPNVLYRGGLIGTLGVTFNNFSLRNLFNGKAWKPLPQGDGQKVSIRAQTNGNFYQSYNFSFTEPWLGGKKPNSFTLAGFYTRNGSIFDVDQSFSIGQISIGLGSRLTWPDDNFVTNTTINLQNIRLDKFASPIFLLPNGEIISDGSFRNFYLSQTFGRSTVADPIFPKDGSSFSLTMQLTPPYSLFRSDDYYDQDLTPQELYRYIEYHKWKFAAEWYKTIWGKLVLKASAKMGFLGSYSEKVGDVPFERFEFASEPLANQFTITGRDQIYFRGYETFDFPAQTVFTPGNTNPIISGATIYNKYSLELRYPISLNPSSTIFVLAFADAGNAWRRFRDYDPFGLRRAAGLGLRVFLPMFGTLGFDWGLGFDKDNIIDSDGKWDWGRIANFQVILGFEPE